MERLASAWLRLCGVAALLLLSLAVSGCAVTMVPPYDEQIDTGLTQLYGDTVVFVDNMIASAGTPEGTYAQNQAFYNEALGTIESLSVRAEAHRVMNDCPSTALVARAFASARIPDEVKGAIGSLPKDDCQVVLLRLIGDGFRDMRDLHQAGGDQGLPPQARGQLIDGGVGAQLRAAITVEVAKRAK